MTLYSNVKCTYKTVGPTASTPQLSDLYPLYKAEPHPADVGEVGPHTHTHTHTHTEQHTFYIYVDGHNDGFEMMV